MRKRTRAREACLQALYQFDACGRQDPEEASQIIEDAKLQKDTHQYAMSLFEEGISLHETLFNIIQASAHNWEIQRMAVLDRNILLIGTLELLYREDIPDLVAIDEAIELAKRYGSEDSGGFVNGILDKIRLTHRPEAK